MTTKKSQNDYRIVVLQRGWVYVGKFSRKGEDCTLTGAHCIRRWGTTKGLGELMDGPKSSTVLDFAGTVEFHVLTMIHSIIVNSDAWEKVCGK